jgi:signal transduction histidine kinase
VTAALVAGLLLDSFLHTMLYVSLFLCAIMFAAWFGGLCPSLRAMADVTDLPHHLAIRSFVQSGEVVVFVCDCGISIDRSNVNRLFNDFFATKSDGMGIGLSIFRSIIEFHGGRIWASHNIGPGMTFQFALPPKAGEAS